MLEDTNVAAWVKLLVMCVMYKYCHRGGYTLLCHIAPGVQVYLGDYCVRAMWQKRVSEGDHRSSRVILPPSGTPWLYGLTDISLQIYQSFPATSLSKQKITLCCQFFFFVSFFCETKRKVANQNQLGHSKWFQHSLSKLMWKESIYDISLTQGQSRYSDRLWTHNKYKRVRQNLISQRETVTRGTLTYCLWYCIKICQHTEFHLNLTCSLWFLPCGLWQGPRSPKTQQCSRRLCLKWEDRGRKQPIKHLWKSQTHLFVDQYGCKVVSGNLIGQEDNHEWL